MNLKTLKDVLQVGKTHGFRDRWYNEKDLRILVIQHAKKMKQDERWEIMNYLIYLFDLTKGDLK